MGANIDNCTRTVRMQQWAAILRECKASGQSNAAYCTANGIHPKTFYYWQNKLRREAANELERRELSLCGATNSQIVPIGFSAAASSCVTIRKAGYTVEITDGTSSATIEAVLSALNRQC
jgi:putative transposase